MNVYAVTFGLKYNHEDEVHPVDERITGNTFATIEAENYDEAHTLAYRRFDGDFAFLYDWDEFIPQIDKYGLVNYETLEEAEA